MSSTFRSRVYATYVTARNRTLAPSDAAGLAPRAPYLKRVIRRHFPRDVHSSIFELGCGHGALLYFAKELGYCNISGVDGSPEQVAAALRLGIADIHHGDIIATLRNLPSQSKDCIVAFDVIEHFTRDELIGLVDEVARVLKPEGRWIIHVPNGEGPFAGRSRYWDITHEIAFTRTSLSQLLLASGFDNVSCFEDAPIPHGPTSLMRWILWKGIRGALRLYVAVETGDIDGEMIFTQNLLAVASRVQSSVVRRL